MFKVPWLPCRRVEKILSAASAQMSYPIALESEASQVFSLKESCPVEMAQKYYRVCECRPDAWHHNCCLLEADRDSIQC